MKTVSTNHCGACIFGPNSKNQMQPHQRRMGEDHPNCHRRHLHHHKVRVLLRMQMGQSKSSSRGLRQQCIHSLHMYSVNCTLSTLVGCCRGVLFFRGVAQRGTHIQHIDIRVHVEKYMQLHIHHMDIQCIRTPHAHTIDTCTTCNTPPTHTQTHTKTHTAIGANVLIFLAKLGVYAASGSSALLAEAIHSIADIGNQVWCRGYVCVCVCVCIY